MITLYKGLLGAAGAASGTGVVALGIYKFRSSEKPKISIASLLTSNNKNRRKLIKSSNGEEETWKSVWKKYREDFHSSDKNPFSLTWAKGTTSVNSVNASSEFMNACELQETKRVRNIGDKDYKLFLDYCTRSTLMSDLVKENPSRKALVKIDTETNDAKWVKVWGEYKKYNQNKAAQGDHWKLQDWTNPPQGDKVPVSFMAKCDTELKREYYDAEGDDYKKVISWCTEEMSF